MSYQVLARKWRPRRFVEMVGQEHVLKALVNALDDDRLHHAYLFTGTRGVGKTSIARLFAKSLNCEQGVSSEPCGTCSACTEIAEGRFVDLIEVDAASRTKVEDTRELLENVQYAPTQGRYKVYLIDEVHMLSGHSFNALLKTLEEPPPHIKFLLATTDPQKLPITILSRCLQFNLKNLAPERIVEHLTFVLGEEQIQAEEAALWLLARAAEGSMRDALSLTDQSIAFGAGAVREADVRAMLGTIDHRMVFELLDALAHGDGMRLVKIVAAMAEFAPDYAGVLAEMISILHRIALAQVVPDAIDNALGDKQQILDLAKRLRAEEVQLYYQIALTGRKDLAMVPQPREGLEMTLLRMLAFRPSDQRPVNGTAVNDQHSNSAPEKLAVPAPTAPPPMSNLPTATAHTAKPEPVVSAAPAPAPAPAPKSAPAQNSSVSTDEPPPWDEEPVPVDAYGDQDLKKSETDTAEAALAAAQPSASLAPQVRDSAGPAASSELPLADAEQHPSAQDPLASSSAEPNRNSGLAPEPATELAALQLEHWLRLVEELGLSGMTESLARNLSLEKIACNRLVLHYTREQEAMLSEVHRTRISEALLGHFAEPLQVEFVLAAQQRETPQLYRQRRDRERRAAALAHLQADPAVRQIIETFSAEIITDSVEPLNIE